jgi:hypothetical protein
MGISLYVALQIRTECRAGLGALCGVRLSCQATSGEQAAGNITDPSAPLPTFSPTSLCCFALSASDGMQMDGSEMSFSARWQISPDTYPAVRAIEPAWAILSHAVGQTAQRPAGFPNLSKCTQAGSIIAALG